MHSAIRNWLRARANYLGQPDAESQDAFGYADEVLFCHFIQGWSSVGDALVTDAFHEFKLSLVRGCRCGKN
jgi:hypothetical protein